MPTKQHDIETVVSSHRMVAQAHKQIRVLGERTLKKLMRIGSQKIPGVSDLELYFILKDGPSKPQYEKLQQGLAVIKLKPIVEASSMSPMLMHDKLILKFAHRWCNEVILDFQHKTFAQQRLALIHAVQLVDDGYLNSDKAFLMVHQALLSNNPKEYSYILLLLKKLADKHLIQQHNVHYIIQVINDGIGSLKSLEQADAIKLIQSLQSQGLLTSQQIGQVLQLVQDVTLHANSLVQLPIGDLMYEFLRYKDLTASDLFLVIQWVDHSLGSSDEMVSNQSMDLLDVIIHRANLSKENGAYTSNVLEKYRDLWPEHQFVVLQEDLVERIVNIKNPSFLSKMQAHASNLARYNPTSYWKVAPSQEQLELQREQMLKFNTQQRNAVHQKPFVQYPPDATMQQTQGYEQGQRVTLSAWKMPSMVALKARMKQLLPQVIRKV